MVSINMALSPKDMDGFLPLLATADTRTKLTLAMNLINYLGDPDNSIECSDIGQFIDGLIPWMQSSNNKVSAFCPSFEYCMVHPVVIPLWSSYSLT